MIKQLPAPATPTLSTLIVDPDPAAIRRLEAALAPHPDVAIGGTALDIVAAVEQASRCRPDVVFVDVAMAGGAGMTLPRQLDGHPAVVVVTDRPDYAVAAFEFGAVDYLLKPVREERLRETLLRLRRLRRLADGAKGFRKRETTAETSAAGRRRIDSLLPIRSGRDKRTAIVPAADILWIEAVQNYSIVQMQNGERRRLKRTLTEWESLLPRGDFARVGRSLLLQVAKLRETESRSRDDLLVHFTGFAEPLRLGRSAAGRLKGVLEAAQRREPPRRR
jgi:two-component system LytT family response regulator